MDRNYKQIILLFALLVGVNGYLLHQNITFKKSITVQGEYIKLRQIADKYDKYDLKNFKIYDLNNNEVKLETVLKQKKYTIIFSFSPDDCGTCLFNTELLVKNFASFPDFQLIGLSDYSYLGELRDYVNNKQLKFKIFQDKKGELLQCFYPLKTPFLLVASTNGKAVLVDNSIRFSESSRKIFISLLKLL